MRIKVNREDVVTYVPDYDDNRERAAAGGKCFEVDIKPMSGADYERSHQAFFGGKKQKGGSYLRRAQKFVDRMVTENVVAVRGFEVEDSNGEIVATPDNSAELIKCIRMGDAAALAILEDIADAIKDESSLSAGELGNLRRQSASSASPTAPSEAGPASGAEDLSSRTETPSLMSASATESGTGKPATATPTHTAISTSPGTPN